MSKSKNAAKAANTSANTTRSTKEHGELPAGSFIVNRGAKDERVIMRTANRADLAKRGAPIGPNGDFGDSSAWRRVWSACGALLAAGEPLPHGKDDAAYKPFCDALDKVTLSNCKQEVSAFRSVYGLSSRVSAKPASE